MKASLKLRDAYGVRLERIKGPGEEKAKLVAATLAWVCHSERPLQVDEFSHPLTVEKGATDFDSENIPSTFFPPPPSQRCVFERYPAALCLIGNGLFRPAVNRT